MDLSPATFSNWLEQATQPGSPYYHPVQVTLFAGISYIGTMCFTSLPPVHGVSLVILAYTISQTVTPLFVECCEPYHDLSLAPMIGQILQITLSFVLAKFVCHLAGHSISFQEVRQIALVFLVSLYVSRFFLLKLRQQLA